MTKTAYYPPEYEKKEFNCAYCKVFARQIWSELRVSDLFSEVYLSSDLLTVSKCTHCHKWSIWIEESLVYPAQITVEDPNDDMPDEVKKLYRESAQVLSISPRAAAALLRLGLQILLGAVGGGGKNIDNNIKKIVESGVDRETQRALDTLRVFGNSGAHPEEIKLDENPDLVYKMYELMNIVTERLITRKNKIDELYDILPEKKKDHIKSRDSKNKNKNKNKEKL